MARNSHYKYDWNFLLNGSTHTLICRETPGPGVFTCLPESMRSAALQAARTRGITVEVKLSATGRPPVHTVEITATGPAPTGMLHLREAVIHLKEAAVNLGADWPGILFLAQSASALQTEISREQRQLEDEHLASAGQAGTQAGRAGDDDRPTWVEDERPGRKR